MSLSMTDRASRYRHGEKWCRGTGAWERSETGDGSCGRLKKKNRGVQAPGQARPHPDASASAIRRALSENRGKPVGG